jgi:Fe-S-cluster-containing hydrogenase component 2
MDPSELLSRALAQECIECGLCLMECTYFFIWQVSQSLLMEKAVSPS